MEFKVFSASFSVIFKFVDIATEWNLKAALIQECLLPPVCRYSNRMEFKAGMVSEGRNH